ncbi:enamine deaminase RidA [Catellatospora sp. TT07R-123]|uniref:RidA family protein n=1 Tax=Catellatospora sp. TT07R-123 TaxID=2733863 RepID=UPI001B01C502|nr:RidA family protein [Catellatospora sp. TT07R-123]GHJ48114.1 enamine deaminase RidA [Catellatospora sp. TT07R-123]
MSHVVRIPAPEGLAGSPNYSHVVHGTGRLVAVAGQVAFDADGRLVGAGDPLAQARQVFANLGTALAAAGATFADVVKLGCFVTDVAYLPAIRDARAEAMGEVLPASTAVQVVALFRPELLLEVEAWAIVREDRA